MLKSAGVLSSQLQILVHHRFSATKALPILEKGQSCIGCRRFPRSEIDFLRLTLSLKIESSGNAADPLGDKKLHRYFLYQIESGNALDPLRFCQRGMHRLCDHRMPKQNSIKRPLPLPLQLLFQRFTVQNQWNGCECLCGD
jgi:hypothetical protein